MVIDPICGMKVKEDSPFKVQKDGTIHYFCSAPCKEKFLSAAPAGESPSQCLQQK